MRQADGWSLLLAALLAATVVAAIHVALGLVFDPRYENFQLTLLSGPVLALAIVAFLGGRMRAGPGLAESVTAALLAGSAFYIIANEGIGNWQALWFGSLLVILAFAVLLARPAPD